MCLSHTVFFQMLVHPVACILFHILSIVWHKATNTNFLVFGLTRTGLWPTIYCTQGEDANHYTKDMVNSSCWFTLPMYTKIQKLQNVCLVSIINLLSKEIQQIHIWHLQKEILDNHSSVLCSFWDFFGQKIYYGDKTDINLLIWLTVLVDLNYPCTCIIWCGITKTDINFHPPLFHLVFFMRNVVSFQIKFK
jgi:hypothetical protein